MGRKREKRMEIKVRIAEEADVERVAILYEKLHDYLETHENHPRWKRGIYPTKADAQDNHVYEKNDSAIRFYESCGFSRRGTIDLGLEELYGLKWYYAYEKPV